MYVRELGNRVWQIYIYTLLLGTLIASIGISITIFDPAMTAVLFFFGILTTGIFSLPNIFILNLGLKYIYKTSKNEDEKRQYFIYLWIVLCIVPLVGSLSLFMDGVLFSDFEVLLLPLPYVISSLYYIFKINNKFDKIYPPDFSKNRELSTDILDDDF